MSMRKTLAITKSLAIHLAVALPLLIGAKKELLKPKLVAQAIFITQPEVLPAAPASKPSLKPKALKKSERAHIKPSATERAKAGEQGETAGFGGQAHGNEEGSNIVRESPVLIANDHKVSYPEKAKLKMLEGIVLLRLTISEHGRVIKAEVLSGHNEFIKAALKLADKLFFLPATDHKGSPKVALIEHEVVFRLRQST